MCVCVCVCPDGKLSTDLITASAQCQRIYFKLPIKSSFVLIYAQNVLCFFFVLQNIAIHSFLWPKFQNVPNAKRARLREKNTHTFKTSERLEPDNLRNKTDVIASAFAPAFCFVLCKCKCVDQHLSSSGFVISVENGISHKGIQFVSHFSSLCLRAQMQKRHSFIYVELI